MKNKLLTALAMCLVAPPFGVAADNVKLKPDLDFMKNRWQGLLITGDHMDDGVVKGMPNYILFYGEYCYNAKRQALRTVELYRDYGSRVHFVIINLSRPVPRRTQMPLVKKYFRADFPHTTIFDKNGNVVFDYTGEVDAATLIGWLDAALRSEADQQQQGAESPSSIGTGDSGPN